MSRWTQRRWSGRAGRKAWSAVRFCAALWMVLYIAYTPIHLYLEPHCDDSHVRSGAALAHSSHCVAGETHDGDDHQERHPAAQHKFKVTQANRAIVAETVPVQLMEWATPHEDCPLPQAVEFSGLSPPELSRCWQFIFRAALPVRAPALLS